MKKLIAIVSLFFQLALPLTLNAQGAPGLPFGGGEPSGGQAPVGGLAVLAALGGGYAVKKLREGGSSSS